MSKLHLMTVKKLLLIAIVCFSFVTNTQAVERVGAIAGEFNVSKTGAATYNIPVEIPPGINGLQPELAFIYNSRIETGMLGLGWKVKGLSSIYRCNKTLAIDDEVHSVDFTQDDRLCIDGQKLIAISGSNTDSGYWSAAEYRTEIESFLKVTRFGSGFKVETKNGRIAKYGNTGNSIKKVRKYNASTEHILSWAISEIADQHQNTIEYSYFIDVANGVHRIASMNYAGAANASVQFSYENRPDILNYYISGAKLSNSARLKSIETRSDSNPDPVTSYTLRYDNDGLVNGTRLKEINQCVGLECKKSTKFDWDVVNNQFLGDIKSEYINVGEDDSISWADIDGDGRADFCLKSRYKIQCTVAINSGFGATFKSGASNLRLNQSGISRQWADFNGDGRDDYCLADLNNSAVQCTVLTATGFGATYSLGALSLGYAVSWGDFNGDGKADFCRVDDRSRVKCTVSTGTGFGATYTSTLNIRDRDLAKSWVDFNGDGKIDYCRSYGTRSLQCTVSTGTGFGATYTSGALNLGYDDTDYNINPVRSWVDFNGDGKADFCRVIDSSHIQCTESTGAGFGNTYTSARIGTGTNYSEFAKSWVDFNGDGKVDYCRAVGGYKIQCTESTGTGFGATFTSGQLNIGSEVPGNRWVDFNGDGRADYCRLTVSNVRCTINGKKPSKIIGITSGTGVQTTISYESLTNSDVYTKDNDAEYPVVDIQSSMKVVSKVVVDSVADSFNYKTYKYAGLKYDLLARRSLGFRLMSSLDWPSILTKTNIYGQKSPYIGMLMSSSVAHNGKKLTHTTNIIKTDFKSNSGMYLPYTSKSTTTNYELDKALFSTVTTDTTLDKFGNTDLKTVTTTTPGGEHFKTVIDNEFDKKYSPAAWYEIGQLTSTSTHSEVDYGHLISEVVNKAFTYKPNGLLETETLEPGTADELMKTYGYDNFGNRKSVTTSGADIATRTSTTIYDTNGIFPETIKNAMDHTETRAYDARFGVLKSRTGPNGLTTTYEYDSFGRQEAIQTANGTRTEITREWCDINFGHICNIPAILPAYYNQNVSYIVTTRQKGGSSLTEYTPPVKSYFDKFGREVRRESRAFDNSPVYVDTNYDWQGRIVAKTQPYFSSDSNEKNPELYVYDRIDRIIQQTSSTGTVVDVTYDGFTTTTTANIINPSRIETKVDTYNAIGQLISTLDNANQLLKFGYNANGQRTTTTDPMNVDNAVTVEYDKFGRKKWMNDPDMGRWVYTYNVLGELETQKDAKNQTTLMQYDVLGRMTKRTDHDGLISQWFYNDNKKAGNTPRYKAIGKLDYTTSSNGYRKDIYYDLYGRPSYSTVNILGASYRTDTNYDVYGRLNTISYPNSVGRFAVKHAYQNGFLQKVTSTNGASTYWQADFRRADGQVQSDHYGNNIQIMRNFDSGGRTTWLNMGNATTIYDAVYNYDSIGNVTGRTTQRDQNAATVLVEGYIYDDLNRLTDVNINNMGNVTTVYDGLGNIESKTGVGAYTYYPDRPHAVKTAGANDYIYDANGSLDSGAGRTVIWSSYNKPVHIFNAAASSRFDYGPERSRFRHIDLDKTAGTTQVTHYVNDSFEKVVKGTLTEYKHYIRAAGQTIAIHTRRSNNVTNTEYLLRDTQGTVVASTDESGQVKAHLDYSAFGARRPISGQSFISSFIESLPRGYTGHEHLDKLGLIHMNGRVYDPKISRFLSADPLVQAPNNLQSLNRYSYVMNNPMAFTDPSGFRSLSDAWGSVKDFGTRSWNFLDDAWANAWDNTDDFFDRLDDWGRENLPEGGEGGYTHEGSFDTGGGSSRRSDSGQSRSNVDNISSGGNSLGTISNLTPYTPNYNLYTGGLEQFQTDVWYALGQLRAFPEFLEMEIAAGGFNYTFDLLVDTSYNSTTTPPTINLNPGTMTLDYLTIEPPDFDSRFSDNYAAQDRYRDNYPEYAPFSIERIIFHEVVHSTQPAYSGNDYVLFTERFEKEPIARTNDFMDRNFNEPYRRNHRDARSRF